MYIGPLGNNLYSDNMFNVINWTTVNCGFKNHKLDGTFFIHIIFGNKQILDYKNILLYSSFNWDLWIYWSEVIQLMLETL